jgi:uncharacterized protein
MLRDKISDTLKEAMKAKDSANVGTLRLIMAALKDRDIAARGSGNCDGISDDEALGMLQSMIKQRRDSIEMYNQGNRPELAEAEQAEIAIIEQFLPQQMNDGEIDAAVDAAIADGGATSIKDMGKVMGALKGTHAGQMDFGKASQVVKAKLA